MAIFECATDGIASLVWPSAILVKYLDQSGLLQIDQLAFEDGKSLDGSSAKVRLTLDNGEKHEDDEVLDHVLSLALPKSSAIPSANEAGLINEWFARTKAFTALEYQKLKKPLEELDSHLLLRSYIVGYELNFADLYTWAILRSNSIALANIRKSAININRWYNFVEAGNPWLTDVVKDLTRHVAQRDKAISTRGASYKIDLPSFDGPMTTRFPPEPSGYLHIGHAKAALLNDYFAHHNGQRGTLICRFDDTNPSKESMEFQDAIVEDLKLLQIYADRTSYSSDYFQEMYEYAVKLIKDGKAFADDSELGQGDTDRINRLPSKRRDLSIEDTLARFEEMKTGSTEGQRWCLRARIAYDSPNGTLRDPVIFRCNLLPHHRTGSTWKIYPTYDFCAPILDALEGVTLALRTNEYRDRNVQYAWMQEALGLRKVPIYDFSRFNLIRTLLSKRKLTKIVDEGMVWGWDDPRMPTIRGIVRRGMTVEALRDFILKQGPSRNVVNLEWGALWSANKKVIDPIGPRHTGISEVNVVRCQISGVDQTFSELKPRHAKNAAVGKKTVWYGRSILVEQDDAQSFEFDEEITLMNWGNAIVRQISKDSTTNLVIAIELELHLEGDVKKTKKKITWLADLEDNLVPVVLYTFDYLITKDKVEKTDELKDLLNPSTFTRTEARADCDVGKLPMGTTLQFDRKGYFKLDAVRSEIEGKLVFFDVPSGKS